MMKVVGKGSTVLSEIPLVALQTIDSKNTSICCATCMAFIGDWSTQADMLISKYKHNNERLTAGECKYKESCIQQLYATGAAVCCEEGACGNGMSCKTIFCSIACRETANISWHALECSAQADGTAAECESNIMKEFEEHSLKTEEIFLAVRRVITTLCMQNISAVIPLTSTDNIKDSISKLQDIIDIQAEVATQIKSNVLSTVEWFKTSFPVQSYLGNPIITELSTTTSVVAKELRETALESWLLLHSALIEKGLSTAIFGPLMSCSFFGEVLYALEKYLHSMNMSEGPLLPHLSAYLAQRSSNTSSGSNICSGSSTSIKSTKEYIYLRKLLRTAGIYEEKQVTERLEDKLLLITEINALETNAGSIATAAGLSTTATDEDSLFLFTGKDCHSTCMVLLPFCSRYLRHSCLPNIQISAHTSTTAIVTENQQINEVRLVPTLQTLTADTTTTAKCLPRVDIIALHPITIPVNHTEAEYTSLGSSLCLSYIDEAALSVSEDSLSFQSRQEQLNARFQLCSSNGEDNQDTSDPKCSQVCTCIRCYYEASRLQAYPLQLSPGTRSLLEEVDQHGAVFVKDISMEEVLSLGHLYMQQNNYHYARVIYASLLTRFLSSKSWKSLLVRLDSTDSTVLMASEGSDCMQGTSAEDNQVAGEVLHALGAAYLEDGDWRRSRQAWKMGLQLCPDHPQLTAEVVKIDCYPEATVSITHSSSNREDILVQKEVSTNLVVPRRSACSLQYHRFSTQVRDKDYHLTSTATHKDANKQVWDHLPSYLKIQTETSTKLTVEPPQVFVSCNEAEPLVTLEECKWVIDTTEAYAAQAGGWTTSRHYAVPTTDIPVHVVKSTTSVCDPVSSTGKEDAQQLQLLEWFRDLFLQRLGPLLAVQFQDLFQLDHPVHVAIHDAFVVKYDTSLPMNPIKQKQTGSREQTNIDMSTQLDPPQGQTYLPLHCDQSSHSFTIALNSSGEYEGGGTYFPALGSVIRPDAGQVLSFPGGTILHGGEPILRGKRYILAVFAYIAGVPRIPNLRSIHQIDSEEQDNRQAKRSRHGDCMGLSQVIWKTTSTTDNIFMNNTINNTISTGINSSSTVIGEEEGKTSLFSFNFG